MPDAPVSTRVIAYPNYEASGTGPPCWEDLYPDVLSEERKQVLLAYWRDLFSGAGVPEVLPIPAEVEEEVLLEFPGKHSEAFWKGAREEYAMRWFYGGDWVAYYETPRGCVIVAISRPEYVWLIQSVTDEQRLKADVTYPPPWKEVIG